MSAMTIYLRIARDKDGKILVRASTEQKWDAIASSANPLFTKPTALPTVRRTVQVEVSDKELAGVD